MRPATITIKAGFFIRFDMTKIFNRGIAIILLALLLSSCQNRIEIGDVKNFAILGLDGNKVNCRAEMEIVNTSWFPCKIESGEIHALANGNDLGLVKLSSPVKIGGHSSKTYELNFYLEIKNPEAGIFTLLNNLFGKKSSYKLKGNVITRTFIFHRTIDFDKEVTGN